MKKFLRVIYLFTFILIILFISEYHENTAEMIDMSTLDFNPSPGDNRNIVISKYQNYLEENIINNIKSFESIEDASIEIDQSGETHLILLALTLQEGCLDITSNDKEAIEDVNGR